jgi:NAD+ synthase (glutamine-hydrolysing)
VVSTSSANICAYSYSELLVPNALHATVSENAITIHAISTASHHELGGFEKRFLDLQVAARETGGVLIYSDQRGCGGDRTYSDGCAMILVDGELVAQGRQFDLEDVEVITATINLPELGTPQKDDIRANGESQDSTVGKRVQVDYDLGTVAPATLLNGHKQYEKLPFFSVEEQMALGPACWLFDYLRRSNSVGFLVPLSGGIDSCCTATIIFSMCRIVTESIRNGNAQALLDVQHIVGIKDWVPTTPQELCNRILHTVYMGVSGISSDKTRSRAKRLAQSIDSYHTDMNIDNVFQAEKKLLQQYLDYTPDFDSKRPQENLALQNIQARIRMVTAYYFAQMLPTTRKRPGGGSLLVLGSINVEECLRGSLTKHDCSSADLSPIGSFSKLEIRAFVKWASKAFALPVLNEFLDATPTAELEPFRFNQNDFKDMGMKQEELSTFARLRKEKRLGPYSMLQHVLREWGSHKSPKAIADLVSPSDDGTESYVVI